MNQPWILLFAKAPLLGTVKTRLGAGVGALEALRIYRYLAQRQMTAILESGLSCVIWTTPSGSEAEVAAWLGGATQVCLQPDGDLGVRMFHACQEAFAQGAPGVILVGTDCPDLDAPRLQRIATEVSQGRYVIQPALDGGYVAFGLPQPCPKAFQDIAWSTDNVCASTLERLRSQGHIPTELAPLRDIDTQADWEEYKSRELPPF